METISPADILGYAGGFMTLVAFAQTEVRRMRIAAIAANVFFILFALGTPALPVLALHALLLPLNVYRLCEAVRRPPFRMAHQQDLIEFVGPGRAGSAQG